MPRRRGAARRVSRASVYRILDQLERLHLVQRVETGQAMVRYERVAEREHHHHLVCDECGAGDAVLGRRPRARHRQALKERAPGGLEQEIVLHGVCRDCAP